MASSDASLKVLAAGLPELECDLLGSWLTPEGTAFGVAQGGPLQCMAEQADVVLVDGAELLKDARWLDEAGRAAYTPAIVAVVARGGVVETVEALRNGATDCLVRPLRLDKLQVVLRNASGVKALQGRVERMRGSGDGGDAVGRIVGESPVMRQALALAARAADYPVDVLIRGETGTGKELFARALHAMSGRRQGPFVAVDCGALPSELFESLLFGHRKGAFTGANEDHVGLLAQAQGGTLFLDEVGNLPLDAQAKLLRALQTRETWRLGDVQASSLDIRVLAATHHDLEAAAAEGSFRLDFYHRLRDFPLTLPPLRQRAGDILLLAKLFLDRHRTRFQLPPLQLDEEVSAHLNAYPWPGNVRQLENAMKHAAVMGNGTVTLADLPEDLRRWVAPAGELALPSDPGFEAVLPTPVMPLWQAEKLVARVERQAVGSG
jgi:two-component system response regulator AtoC